MSLKYEPHPELSTLNTQPEQEGVAGVVATPGTMLPLKFRYFLLLLYYSRA